jgi:hypothetical protein
MSQPIAKHPVSVVAAILSYLIPGLGQIYQGRVSKGLMFMVCLLGMFIGGQVLGDWRNVYLPPIDPGNQAPAPRGRFGGIFRAVGDFFPALLGRWHYGGQFWIGIAAWPAIWQYNNLPVPSMEKSPFLHNLQKTQVDPADFNVEQNMNVYLRNQDKTPDVAWVYTVVAGILNILVIYDAFAGPAHGSEEERK